MPGNSERLRAQLPDRRTALAAPHGRPGRSYDAVWRRIEQ